MPDPVRFFDGAPPRSIAHRAATTALGERGDEHSLLRARVGDRGDRGGEGGIGLDVDVEARIRKSFERLRECRETASSDQLESAQLVPCQPFDRHVDTRDP
jgi:hypothetical protein